jgi:MarR family
VTEIPAELDIVVADNITAIRPLDEAAALAWLRSQPGGSIKLPAAALARRWGWPEHRARRRLNAWQKSGLVRRRGRAVTAVGDGVARTVDRTPDQTPDRILDEVVWTGVGKSAQRSHVALKNSPAVRRAAHAAGQAVQLVEFSVSRRVNQEVDERDSGPVATVATPPEPTSAPMDRDHGPQGVRPDISGPEIQTSKNAPGRLADMLAYAVAIGLAATAAWFSLKGLTVLFPGAPHEIVVMGAIMECAKLVACGWLAGRWRHVPWVFRGVLMLLIAGVAVINASGTFSQLTAAHVGNRTMSAATRAMQATDLDARIEVAAAKLADLDRRIASIDAIVAGAAQRGRANTAASIMTDQHKARTALVAERERAAQALADLKVERANVQARASIAESEAMPLRYAAELIGVGGDSEEAIRWLIALMVLVLRSSCDRVDCRGVGTAINHRLRPLLVGCTFNRRYRAAQRLRATS